MNLIKKNIDAIVIVFLMGFLISDFVTSIAYKLAPNSFYRYAGAIKLLFEAIMIVLIVSNFKKPILKFQ